MSLFGKKKQEEVTKAVVPTPEVLYKSNIILNCPSESYEDAIKRSGKLLVQAGYAKERYIEGMLERERVMTVAIGNGIAIPHGENEYKKDILHTGLVVCAYPDGLDWKGEKVYLSVGIAALGDEHIDILARIAEYFGEDAAAAGRLAAQGDVDAIYSILEGEAPA